MWRANNVARAAEAAAGLQFRVIVKPNIGGSGAGIVKFDTPGQLASASFDLGIDSTALVQEFLRAISQSEFAGLIGVSVKTLQNWEQDRRRPTGPAVALLKIIAREPKLAVEAIHRR